MRLDAALGAAHDTGCFGNIHIFPVTQKESFTLTRWQRFYLFFNYPKELRLLELVIRGLRAIRAGFAADRFERIVILVVSRRKRREQSGPQGAHTASSIVVAYRVLQYALEQHRQLGQRVITIFLGELHHRVLHDIECGLFVAHRKHGLLESTALDCSEKIRQFALAGQSENPSGCGFEGVSAGAGLVNALTNRGQSFNVADFFRAICLLGRRQ